MWFCRGLLCYLLIFLLFSCNAIAQTCRGADSPDSTTYLSGSKSFEIDARIRISTRTMFDAQVGSRYAIWSRYSSSKNARGYIFGLEKTQQSLGPVPFLVYSTDGTGPHTKIKYAGSPLAQADIGGWMTLTVSYDVSSGVVTFFKDGAQISTSRIPVTDRAQFGSHAPARIGCVEQSTFTPDFIFSGEISSAAAREGTFTSADIASLDSPYQLPVNFWYFFGADSSGAPAFGSAQSDFSEFPYPFSAATLGAPRSPKAAGVIRNLQATAQWAANDVALASVRKRMIIPGYNLLGSAQSNPLGMSQLISQTAAQLNKLNSYDIVLDDFFSYQPGSSSHLQKPSLTAVCSAKQASDPENRARLMPVLYCGDQGLMDRQKSAIKLLYPASSANSQIDGFADLVLGMRQSGNQSLAQCLGGAEIFLSPAMQRSLSSGVSQGVASQNIANQLDACVLKLKNSLGWNFPVMAGGYISSPPGIDLTLDEKTNLIYGTAKMQHADGVTLYVLPTTPQVMTNSANLPRKASIFMTETEEARQIRSYILPNLLRDIESWRAAK